MSQKVHSFVINLFGTAIQSWELAITPSLKSELDRLRSAQHFTIQEILFDLDLIRRLGVTHWTELGKRIGGLELLLNNEARIELRKNGRLAERILVKDLLEPMQLFAKYNTTILSKNTLKPDSLIVLERLKGQTAKYTFETMHFQMDQLEFGLANDSFTSDIRLSTISFRQKLLRSIREEVLIMGQEVIKLHTP
jgi:hypothetical protein